jgi:hypothetical protein
VPPLSVVQDSNAKASGHSTPVHASQRPSTLQVCVPVSSVGKSHAIVAPGEHASAPPLAS